MNAPLEFGPADFDPSEAEVFAAGGVVWRHGSELEVLVVHRPHRLDWSLPKGKVDPGESLEETAVREILEETGLVCRLGRSLGSVSYRDHKRRAKTVSYWVMHVLDGTETLNAEVDEMTWLTVAAATDRLSYETDRLVLERFLAVVPELG